MNELPTVLLKPGSANRIVAGHPWIFGGDILRLTQDAGDGDPVQIKDHRQRFLGTGFYNSRSKIKARLISRERVEFDRAFFERRINDAQAVRQRHLPGATSFRAVNSESDFLSGLVVDKYEDVLVLQTTALGMDQRKDAIVAALEAIFSPRAIVERNDSHFRKFEGLDKRHGVIRGALDPMKVEARLNGLSFDVDLSGGHKTGLYLDQQANYEAVAQLLPESSPARVLDCFTFLGGFALHAARRGAQVTGVDQSESALAMAAQNAERNGLADRCSFQHANVFDWLKESTTTAPGEKLEPEFDAVVLDPPSFTRNRASVPNALRGYKDIHLRAMKLIRDNGILATFCCSHHVDAATFLDVILAAAFDARVMLRRIDTYSQSPDHPVLPAIAETEYLKGFAFEIVR